MADVFISYSSKDRPLARDLANWLKGCGLSVWWDFELVGGQDFREEILRELNMATCVIVIWTRNSTASAYVVDEATRAQRARKLIPLRGQELSLDDLPLGLGSKEHMISLEDREAVLRAVRRHVPDTTIQPKVTSQPPSATPKQHPSSAVGQDQRHSTPEKPKSHWLSSMRWDPEAAMAIMGVCLFIGTVIVLVLWPSGVWPLSYIFWLGMLSAIACTVLDDEEFGFDFGPILSWLGILSILILNIFYHSGVSFTELDLAIATIVGLGHLVLAVVFIRAIMVSIEALLYFRDNLPHLLKSGFTNLANLFGTWHWWVIMLSGGILLIFYFASGDLKVLRLGNVLAVISASLGLIIAFVMWWSRE